MPSVTDAAMEREYRDWAASALTDQDWRAAYDAAKGWVARAGGAWIPEAWLVYAASGIFHGQPRIGVRSIDLALSNWVDGAPDRSVLLWSRASITWRYLADPKAAQRDFESAASAAPTWLRAQLDDDLQKCRTAAAVSKKRKPSVADAPVHSAQPLAHDTIAPPPSGHEPGSQPLLWTLLLPVLSNEGHSTDG